MKDCILVTGASSGIGLEMARYLGSLQYDLVLVARRIDRLTDLKTELEGKNAIRVHVLAKDLGDPQNAYALHTELKTAGHEITMLVNNAGAGQYGEFTELPLETQLEMINLNIGSLVALTHLYAKEFREKGRGKILNMASLLSFFPFPYFSVYAATKTFVLSFSEAIRSELANTDVTITAVCPGPVDSPFTTPEMAETTAYRRLPLSSPKWVARKAADAMLAGRGTVILGTLNKLLASTPRFSPRKLTVRINKLMASRPRQKTGKLVPTTEDQRSS